MPIGKKLALISNQAFSILNFRSDLVTAWRESGVSVYGFAPDFSNSTRDELISIGVIPVDFHLERSSMNPWSDLRTIYELAREFRRLSIDVVFSYFMKPVILGSLAAYIAGVSQRFAMIEGLGYLFSNSKKSSLHVRIVRRVVVLLYRAALAATNRYFVLNADDRRFFRNVVGASPDKCVLLPGIGINLSSWQLSPPSLSPVTFMLVARMIKEKGIFEFVAAARSLRERNRNVRFVLVGGIDTAPGAVDIDCLKQWVSEGVVEWLGHVDIKALMPEASVIVLPSYYREGLPRSLLEGLASGRPIVTTDMPGCRDTVVDGVNGLLIKVGDHAGLVEALSFFLDNESAIVRMGKESRKLAEERFDVEAVNATILQSMGLERLFHQ